MLSMSVIEATLSGIVVGIAVWAIQAAIVRIWSKSDNNSGGSTINEGNVYNTSTSISQTTVIEGDVYNHVDRSRHTHNYGKRNGDASENPFVDLAAWLLGALALIVAIAAVRIFLDGLLVGLLIGFGIICLGCTTAATRVVGESGDFRQCWIWLFSGYATSLCLLLGARLLGHPAQGSETVDYARNVLEVGQFGGLIGELVGDSFSLTVLFVSQAIGALLLIVAGIAVVLATLAACGIRAGDGFREPFVAFGRVIDRARQLGSSPLAALLAFVALVLVSGQALALENSFSKPSMEEPKVFVEPRVKGSVLALNVASNASGSLRLQAENFSDSWLSKRQRVEPGVSDISFRLPRRFCSEGCSYETVFSSKGKDDVDSLLAIE